MKNLFLVCFISVAILVGNASAQSNIGFLKDVSGMTVEFKTSSEYIGDPFLTKDWSVALITTANGKMYKDVPIKYNQIENVLYFKDPEGKVNKFSDPIKEFSLTTEGNQTYRQFGSSNFFFHVVYDGKTKLINRDAKYIKENREYNSAIVTKKVSSANKYYIVSLDNSLVEVKLNKKSILSALSAKEESISKYATSEKLDLSKIDDIVKLLIYYDK